MNIESELWKLQSLNAGYVLIIQKASDVSRVVTRQSLPSDICLALAHEITFNRVCREAFHS